MRVITILDNEDGTNEVRMLNMQGKGEEIVIKDARLILDKRSLSNFDICDKSVDYMDFPTPPHQRRITCYLDCFPDKNNILYTVNPNQPKMSNTQLIDELTRRLK